MTKITTRQLDLPGLSGFVGGFAVTGQVVRTYQTGIFATQSDLAQFEVTVSGSMLNVSGNLANTGAYLLTGIIPATGSLLTANLSTTGQTLWARDDALSGTLLSSGQYLNNLFTGLSGGALYQTGQYLNNLFLSYSGNSGLYNTGQLLLRTITGLSGAFDRSGLNLYNLILLESGSFNTTGLNLYNNIFNLSGSLNATGAALTQILNGISGALNISGQRLKSDTDVIFAGLTKVDGLSGAVTVTGAGDITSSLVGQIIYISGISGGANPSKIVNINSITGSIFVTGTGGLSAATIGQTIYISGSFITSGETGQFATTGQLYTTGQTLLTQDLNISGYLASQITSSNAGVSSLNGLSGTVNIVGNGVVVTTGLGTITLSASTPTGLPTWLTNSVDYNTSPGAFDDDFTGSALRSQWSGINLNLDSSGMNNSFFWANGAASSNAGTTQNLSCFAIGVTTGADWEISAKMDFLPRFVNYNSAGLFVRNATAGTVTQYAGEWDSSNGQVHVIGNYTNNTFSSNTLLGSGWTVGYKNVYLRLQCRSNLYNFQTSPDGIIWRNIRSSQTNTWVTAVNQVGFCVNSIGSQVGIAVDWFRATGLS